MDYAQKFGRLSRLSSKKLFRKHSTYLQHNDGLKVEKYPKVSYLTKAITTETSQSSQSSLTVDVNLPRNSMIIT